MNRCKEAAQNPQYLVHGDPCINQRTSGYSERFTFTGKERDEETGYTYHGARYYDANLMCSWFSVDPLSDKYPSVSPYNYCMWNPVMLVDSDGREIDWYRNTQTGCYTWFNGSSEHAGYEHIGGKGSLLGEYEPIIDNILKESGHEGLYKDGLTLDITASDKGALFGSKNGGWDFLDEFLSGTGPEVSILTDKHPYTQDIKGHPRVIESQQQVLEGDTETKGQITNVGYAFGLRGLFKAGFSMAQQFIGSFRYDAFLNQNGDELLNVVSDSKSISSLFYHLKITKDMNHNRGTGTKCMSNTYQFYIWNSPAN